MSTRVKKDTQVQLYCTKPLVTAANRDTFPKSITIQSGHNEAAVVLHTGSPASSITVTIAAGSPRADMSKQEGWDASQELVILAPSAVHKKLHRN